MQTSAVGGRQRITSAQHPRKPQSVGSISFSVAAPLAPAQPRRGGAHAMEQQRPSRCAAVDWYEKAKVGEDLPLEYSDYTPALNRQRRAGVLLHPTSLPGPYGIGELGTETYKAIDWMESAGMQVWQILPTVPPDSFFSPYSGTDANCGNPLLISIDELIREGLLDQPDAPAPVPVAAVDFAKVAAAKYPLLRKAAGRLLKDAKFGQVRSELSRWRTANPWLEASAVFDVARNQEGLNKSAWWDWPEDLRFRKPAAISEFKTKFRTEIDEFIATQFLFERQWRAAKKYANERNIKIVGDMPIYVGGHSADVWSNPELFELSPSGAPSLVSGVPPDAFSDDGQKWGSPVFRWPAHKAENYRWWVQRVKRALELYDETRIDHFRGFAGYWAVEADAPTAMVGTWKKGPGKALFDVLKAKCWPKGEVPILAEDLGVITEDVNELRKYIGSPGMVVLQFAWGGGGSNPHLPHNHYANSFCYPGTHDNETSAGWAKHSASDEDKAVLQKYLNSNLKDIGWDFIRAAYESVSYTSVFMIQDIMRLDNSARMNQPGTTEGNWSWRMGDSDVWDNLQQEARDLRELASMSNRILVKPLAKLEAVAKKALEEPAKVLAHGKT